MTARYEVQIVRPQDGKPRTFSTHDNRETAEVQASKLRRHGFFAQVRRVDAGHAEAPEHGNDRRAFLIWALMLGAIPPERVVDRVLAEVESEVAT